MSVEGGMLIVWLGIFGAFASRAERISFRRAFAPPYSSLWRFWAVLGVVGLSFGGTDAFADVPRDVGDNVEEWCEEQVQSTQLRISCGEMRYTGSDAAGLRPLFEEVPTRSGTLRARVVDEENTNQGWLLLEVEVEARVWVASRTLQAGDNADSGVELRWKNTRLLARDALTDTGVQPRGVSRQTLREGDVVRASSLELPVTVRRQQMVTLEVRRGDVLARGRGIALQDARVGDMVRVQSAFGEQVFTGIVRDNGNVEVP